MRRLSPLERLLAVLYRANRREAWTHGFVTTNWDTLLDRALAARRAPRRPDIRASAEHLNGSIAEHDDGAFLTEADSQDARESRLLRKQLPRSHVSAIETPFDQWIDAEMPELQALGVLKELSAAQSARAGSRRTPDSRAW